MHGGRISSLWFLLDLSHSLTHSLTLTNTLSLLWLARTFVLQSLQWYPLIRHNREEMVAASTSLTSQSLIPNPSFNWCESIVYAHCACAVG